MFLLIRSTQKKQEAQRWQKGVSINMGINYLLFIWIYEDFFLMHSLRKSLSETCITLYIYFTITVFDIKGVKMGILLYLVKFSSNFNTVFLRSVHLCELLMNHTFHFTILRLFGFITLKTLNYLAFQSFDFGRTWWKLFQKCVVCTKFDIYVFIIQNGS
jgi:hypothetical protein